MTRDIENLVFEGGGVKGIAYIGALRVLNEKELLPKIKRVGGASAGAITALALGLGYNLMEVEDILENDTDFRKFADDSWFLVRDAWRLFNEYGIHKGEFFLNWVKKLISNITGDPNINFKQFEELRLAAERGDEETFVSHGKLGDEVKSVKEQMARFKNAKSMYFVVTNLDRQESEVLSHEHETKFDIAIADAVRASMAIPFFFTAYKIPHWSETCTYVDGGVLDNFPIRLFDFFHFTKEGIKGTEEDKIKSANIIFNPKTLGFRVEKKRDIEMLSEGHRLPPDSIDSFKDYVKTLMTVILNGQDTSHKLSRDWTRTIYINSGEIETTQFEIDESQREELIASGETATREYFAKHIEVNSMQRITEIEAQLESLIAELKLLAPPEHIASVQSKFFGAAATQPDSAAAANDETISPDYVHLATNNTHYANP